MAQIIPSILEDNIDRYNDKMIAVLKIPEVQRIQIDFSDGKFTPHLTVMPADIDLLNPTYQWEAHLMVQEPSAHFFDLKVAGFNNVIVHYEAVGAEKIAAVASELKKMNISCGLAINPETEIEKILPFTELVEQIVIMDIMPGYQGQKFIPKTLDKIKKLRNASKNVIIEADGGINISDISDVVAAGADRVIAGSALFDPGSENFTPAQNFERLAAKAQ